MKGKRRSNKNFLSLEVAVEGLMNSLNGSDYDQRKVDRYEIDDLIIDTAFASDTGYFETGIMDKRYYDHWIIVDEYDTKEEALVGHQKWVKVMVKNLPGKLEDIHTGDIFERVS